MSPSLWLLLAWENANLFYEILGIEGWDRVAEKLAPVWLNNVKHQAHHYFTGMLPVRSLIKVGEGAIQFVTLPYKQYKQNGRVVQGIQKGTKYFAKTIASEALNITAKVSTSTQTALETLDKLFFAPSGTESGSELGC